ncbi:BQ5605_C017g08459 [Microbotryum silenes-dioicae]|uniref:BQ5605_C017g08459 protein n=1 Tax=Microbotryum silenes-dioicae TaxID=796604 RepID=A0A2X0MGK2_9BASI|nr:BQ5605_C017g08459 [Microbotryum silenes-dioicae]
MRFSACASGWAFGGPAIRRGAWTPVPPGVGCWMRHWWPPEPGRMDAMDLTAPKFRTLAPRRQVTSGNRSG